MFRKLDKYLDCWADREGRHPLVMRGARQVGKTYLARELAKRKFRTFVELNFEQDAGLSTFFASKNPDKICELLSVRYGCKIADGETLLFLDELQAAEVCVLESLRYFYELRPGLHIIAAGSLLEFLLDGGGRKRDGRDFPMPVGRIEYMHAGPLDFEEFLLACGKGGYVDWLCGYEMGDDVPLAMHDELMEFVRRYLVVGGMPAAVNAYVQGGALDVEREQQLILDTYHDDFPKYSRRARTDLLQKTFRAIPAMLGRKLIYSHIDDGEKSRDLSAAFRLLALARVVAKVSSVPANGVPVGCGADGREFKPLFLDVGLACRALRLKLVDFLESETLLENRGAVCEQFVGQHLMQMREAYEEPEAYCWMREARGSSAEVDYVVQCAGRIVPVEVKSGKSGSMKALQIFLNEKGHDFAVRFNADLPSFLSDATGRDPKRREFRYRLLSLPLYMVCQLERIVRSVIAPRHRQFASAR